MDNDDIGALFRFKDNLNFYQFRWNKQESYRLLQKRVNGTFTTLAQDRVPYVEGRNYQITIVAEGSKLNVLVDGQLVFSVSDSSLDTGTVALYSRFHQGASFDNIMVEDLKTAGILLWDDFEDGDFYGWTILDETTNGGPSVWSIKDGVLVQTSNIGAHDAAKSGTIALY